MLRERDKNGDWRWLKRRSILDTFLFFSLVLLLLEWQIVETLAALASPSIINILRKHFCCFCFWYVSMLHMSFFFLLLLLFDCVSLSFSHWLLLSHRLLPNLSQEEKTPLISILMNEPTRTARNQQGFPLEKNRPINLRLGFLLYLFSLSLFFCLGAALFWEAFDQLRKEGRRRRRRRSR